MKNRPLHKYAKEKSSKIMHKVKHKAKKHTSHVKHAVHKPQPMSHIDMLRLVSSGGPNVADTTHLSRYIERSLRKGIPKERIIGLCLQAGWTKHEINEAFIKAKSIRRKIHALKDYVGRIAGVNASTPELRPGNLSHPKLKKIRPLASAQKIFALALVISLLAYAIFFGNILKRECGNDVNCFDELAKKCTGARLEALKDANIYEYTIKGKIGNECGVSIKLKRMALGIPVDIVNKLEGKDAECKIPMALLKENRINEIENLLSYCSGTLKESVYEVIMDDMYELIIKNMGNITKIVEKDISKFLAQAL